MYNIIQQYGALWAPAIAAVVGIISTAITVIHKIASAADKISNEATNKVITEKYDELQELLKVVISENARLATQNYEIKKLLTRIDYRPENDPKGDK